MDKKKKVVAFTAGRRGGNCEIYVKIALKELTKMGIECEMIRLHECDLPSVSGLPQRSVLTKGPSACVIKDDGPWLAEKFLDSDGYLLAAPVWSLSPCGVVTDFRDRVFGPKMDMSQWEAHGIPDGPERPCKATPWRTDFRRRRAFRTLDLSGACHALYDDLLRSDQCRGQYQHLSGSGPRRSADA